MIDKATEYAHSVVNGEIIACKWVIKACKRHLKDLETGAERGLYYDLEAVKKVLRFFSLLKYTKGEWAGQEFKPSPWQVFIFSNVFGWKKEDGTRRFRFAYLETARKSGKTEGLAGVGLYMLSADGEPGAEIYTAATKRDQARISHAAAKMMVRKSKPLRQRIKIFKDNLHIEETGSKFEPLGADSKTMDGLNVQGGLIDELHAHPNRDVWDVIITGTGARRQPLVFAITTAGFDKHSICWEQHDYTEKVLDGLIEDDSHFGIIYTLDDEDSWQDESVWMKANPNLGVCTKIDDLRMKAKKAAEVPTQLNAFLRLHMNIWTESVTRWISAEKWALCGGEVDTEALRGRTCYGGLDLSSTTDLSAFVLVFPPLNEEDTFKLLPRFWIPSDNIHQRVNRDRVPYDVWERQKFITATPGNVIDYSWILNQISQDAQDYDLLEIAFDRWGSTKIIQDLQNMGFEDKTVKHAQRHLIDFGQGFASMSPPTKEFEKLILEKKISHGNHPVLAWCMSNTVIKQDAAANMKPDKGESTERIDGIVAAIMSLDRAVRDNDSTSKYEEEDILVL